MGYADTLPYQQITIRTGTRADAFTVASAASQDFHIADFLIPDFKRPLSHAYLSIGINNTADTSGANNAFITLGSYGLNDSGGTYRAAVGVAAGNCACGANAYNTAITYLTNGTNMKDYITAGATQGCKFYQVRCAANNLILRNIFAQLDLYFID